MKLNEIKNIQDFQRFLFQQKNENFVQSDDSDYSKTICGTDFRSEILYVLPSTETLENIRFYDNLKFITINNYKIDRKNLDALKKYKNNLIDVSHLHIWNIKQNDLDLISLFPNLTHLLISHVKKADFSFNRLDELMNLTTLCLLSLNKVSDFNFLPNASKSRIKNLSLTYTSNLKSLNGIYKFENLEHLSLYASTTESNKKVDLDDLSGIENLAKLKTFEMGYFRFNNTEMARRLSVLKELKEFIIDNIKYENS